MQNEIIIAQAESEKCQWKIGSVWTFIIINGLNIEQADMPWKRSHLP